MRSKDVEEKLKRAAADAAPDVLDAVLSRCMDEKGKVIEMTANTESGNINSTPAKKRKNAYHWKAFAGLAAALILAFTGYGYYTQFRAVDSIVGLDVNPSIELNVNRQEKVLSAKALNDDAVLILDGMDLSGSNLNVAVNALIGSMLKNGYIDELKNSILITVENKDSGKSRELQERIVKEIDTILNANSIEGSILSQTLEEDSTLKKLAAAYGISIGKAALIQEITAQNPLMTFEDLVNCSIYELDLIAQTKNVDLNNVQSTGNASEKAYIGDEAAMDIALKHAGLDASAITFEKVKLDWDHGVVEYEVEFIAGTTEYEYDIDAVTGEIRKFDMDQNHHSSSSASGSGSTSGSGSGQGSSVPAQGGAADPQTYIGEEKAKSIALAHAGLKASDVTFTKVKLDTHDWDSDDWDHDDREHGGLHPHQPYTDQWYAEYEVEFYKDNVEYEYEIDAVTGEIRKADQDVEDHDHFTGTDSAVQNTPQSSQPSSPSFIGEEKARQIALDKVPGASFTKFELDIDDDDPPKYEGELKKDGMEYEFEIDAVTGALLKWEEERDD